MNSEVHKLREKGYVRAVLPDGYVDWVIEVEGAPGIYLDYEGGHPYEEHELEFIDKDNYTERKLKELLNLYTKEELIEIINKLPCQFNGQNK